jgi:hypothetical protein
MGVDNDGRFLDLGGGGLFGGHFLMGLGRGLGAKNGWSSEKQQ